LFFEIRARSIFQIHTSEMRTAATTVLYSSSCSFEMINLRNVHTRLKMLLIQNKPRRFQGEVRCCSLHNVSKIDSILSSLQHKFYLTPLYTSVISQMQPTQERNMSLDQSSTASQPTDLVHDDVPQENEPSKATSEPAYPPTSKVLVIIAGLFLTAFLIALDRLIIGVAVPSITDHFHSLGDVGWYGSAYLLTSCAFMLFMGRIYTL
jgi:hypothetical protein